MGKKKSKYRYAQEGGGWQQTTQIALEGALLHDPHNESMTTEGEEGRNAESPPQPICEFFSPDAFLALLDDTDKLIEIISENCCYYDDHNQSDRKVLGLQISSLIQKAMDHGIPKRVSYLACPPSLPPEIKDVAATTPEELAWATIIFGFLRQTEQRTLCSRLSKYFCFPGDICPLVCLMLGEDATIDNKEKPSPLLASIYNDSEWPPKTEDLKKKYKEFWSRTFSCKDSEKMNATLKGVITYFLDWMDAFNEELKKQEFNRGITTLLEQLSESAPGLDKLKNQTESQELVFWLSREFLHQLWGSGIPYLFPPSEGAKLVASLSKKTEEPGFSNQKRTKSRAERIQTYCLFSLFSNQENDDFLATLINKGETSLYLLGKNSLWGFGIGNSPYYRAPWFSLPLRKGFASAFGWRGLELSRVPEMSKPKSKEEKTEIRFPGTEDWIRSNRSTTSAIGLPPAFLEAKAASFERLKGWEDEIILSALESGDTTITPFLLFSCFHSAAVATVMSDGYRMTLNDVRRIRESFFYSRPTERIEESIGIKSSADLMDVWLASFLGLKKEACEEELSCWGPIAFRAFLAFSLSSPRETTTLQSIIENYGFPSYYHLVLNRYGCRENDKKKVEKAMSKSKLVAKRLQRTQNEKKQEIMVQEFLRVWEKTMMKNSFNTVLYRKLCDHRTLHAEKMEDLQQRLFAPTSQFSQPYKRGGENEKVAERDYIRQAYSLLNLCPHLMRCEFQELSRCVKECLRARDYRIWVPSPLWNDEHSILYLQEEDVDWFLPSPCSPDSPPWHCEARASLVKIMPRSLCRGSPPTNLSFVSKTFCQKLREHLSRWKHLGEVYGLSGNSNRFKQVVKEVEDWSKEMEPLKDWEEIV